MQELNVIASIVTVGTQSKLVNGTRR